MFQSFALKTRGKNWKGIIKINKIWDSSKLQNHKKFQDQIKTLRKVNSYKTFHLQPISLKEEFEIHIILYFTDFTSLHWLFHKIFEQKHTWTRNISLIKIIIMMIIIVINITIITMQFSSAKLQFAG